MNKCAIIIGVNKTGGLPVLNAAVKGARDFERWAQAQGIVCTTITDEQGLVTTQQIKAAVKQYVDAKTYDQMIVFFAGHGILKGPGDEQWLLSGAPDDPNEAVNVQPSRFLSRNCGIPHVVFISDACRSVPNDPLVTQVLGAAIFPNARPGNKRPDIDMFYATAPGAPAFEVKEDEAVKQYNGLFTQCLLKGLNGKVQEVIERDDKDPGKCLVFARPLKRYLEKSVPEAAEEVNIMLTQLPDVEVTSVPPAYLARLDADVWRNPARGPGTEADVYPQVPARDDEKEKTLIGEDRAEKEAEMKSYVDNTNFDVMSTLNGKMKGDITTQITTDLASLYHARGRESFETHTGFSVIGVDDAFDIITDKGRHDKFRQDDHWHVRIFPDENTNCILLVLRANGNGIPIAVLPGFIGTILVENDAVVNINYLPSRNNDRFSYVESYNDEVSKRRADISLAARYGAFKVSGDRYQIMDTASYLRNYKMLDPTLGLYAAYAYVQAGDIEQVRDIYQFMCGEPEPVLFDVAMLARMEEDNDAALPATNPKKAESPFCPMLTQGWSYLSINYDDYPPLLKRLARHLVPGLWTTFTREGVALIESAIQNNELI